MNLREKLAALLKELEGAKTKEEVDRIKGEIMAVKAQIALSDEKQGILDSMKSDKPVGGKAAKASGRTLGEKAAAAIKAKGISDGTERFSVTTDGSKADDETPAAPTPATHVTPTSYAPAITEVDDEIVTGPRRPLTVADLFAQETTEKEAVTYFVEGTVIGEAGAVGEGDEYPQIQFGDPTAVTDPLKKIGCLYKDSDELLSDAPRLAQNIDNRAEYLMDIKEEDQLLTGSGTGNNIKGLLNRSGLQTATCVGMTAAIKAIKKAKVSIKKATPGFRADALLVNDEDWNEITDQQDANNQFLAGGPFYGPYGNGAGPVEEPPLWGLRVVPTQAIAKGTMVIGAFKLGGSVIRKGGRMIDITNSDGTDFEKGIVAFRPSERLALAVRYPAAFVKLTVTAPSN